VPPGTIAALSGATVLANLSASNVTVGKFEYRRLLVASSAAKNLAVQMYSAAGFGESTSDLAWDGHGMIAERGEIVAETERFALHGNFALVDVDLRALVEDRVRQGSWGQNAAARPELRRVAVDGDEARDTAVFRRLHRRIERSRSSRPIPRCATRCREIFLIKATSLARRLQALPEDARHVVIGVSGGQDSTEALLVATHAVDLLGLPRAHVIGVTMPGFGTSKRTYANACALVRALGATLREVPISDLAGQVFTAIGHDPKVEDHLRERAGVGASSCSSRSPRGRGIDLGTGDLSEIALGWAYGATTCRTTP
jgi:NAD+ synthase (glutamine-hydrolysing)